MKTKVLIIISLMCAGLLTMSCQKNNDLLPDNSLEASVASDEDAKDSNPYDPTVEAMLDPIKNYPNPFVNKTTIEYRVDKITRVSLIVINENGEKIKSLFKGYLKPGIYRAEFDAKGLPAGVYTAILTLDGLRIHERMVKLDDPQAELEGWE